MRFLSPPKRRSGFPCERQRLARSRALPSPRSQRCLDGQGWKSPASQSCRIKSTKSGVERPSSKPSHASLGFVTSHSAIKLSIASISRLKCRTPCALARLLRFAARFSASLAAPGFGFFIPPPLFPVRAAPHKPVRWASQADFPVEAAKLCTLEEGRVYQVGANSH